MSGNIRLTENEIELIEIALASIIDPNEEMQEAIADLQEKLSS